MNFVRMFKPRFAPLVEAGMKLQTVRPTPKRRPAAGDTISLRCWTDKPYRSKQRILREAEISEVMDVAIYADSLHVGYRRLSAEQRDAFAKADGFGSFAELVEWFRETHGLPFEGILIAWSIEPNRE